MEDLSEQFSDQQIDEFKEAFSLFDRNKDGTIYESQVLMVMKALGIHSTEADIKVGRAFLDDLITHNETEQEYMDGADSDDSGTIDFPEFLSLMSKVSLSEENKKCLTDIPAGFVQG